MTQSASSSAAAASQRSRGCSSATISEKRLKEFLEAEVTHFAAMPRKKLTLEDLLKCSSSPRRAAQYIQQEIPKRFASRIRQIEELEGWEADEHFIDIHERYTASFQEMRMTELTASKDLSEFTESVRRLKERQRPVLMNLGQACHRMREQGVKNQAFWNQWMEKFLRSRITTEMLTSQYLAVVSQTERGETAVTGIVDPACDPARICEAAAAAATQLCGSHTGLRPHVDIQVRSKISTSFSYIPIYLHYIVLEVLKNSCAATSNAAYASTSVVDPCDAIGMRNIQVVICSDDWRVAVRISDLAGGIPFEVGDRIWDFLYSGGKAGKSEPSPLQGYGIGLPLARLYAQYLGGSLSLVSLPSFGTDTYLFLPRIDSRRPLVARNDPKED